MSREILTVTDEFKRALEVPLEDCRYDARHRLNLGFDDPSDERRLELYEKIAALRKQQYEATDGEGYLAPVDRKPRWCIPSSNWKAPADVAEALRVIDKAFEIIHDPLTHPKNTPPEQGCHLYRLEKWKGHDFLIKEVSLMWNTEESWPKGEPRSPGMWIVEWVKRHDKANMVGDKAHINHQVCVDKIKASQEDKLAVHKRDMEVAEINYEIINTKWNLDRTQASPFAALTEENQ